MLHSVARRIHAYVGAKLNRAITWHGDLRESLRLLDFPCIRAQRVMLTILGVVAISWALVPTIHFKVLYGH